MRTLRSAPRFFGVFAAILAFGGAAFGQCPTFAPGQAVGTVQAPELIEISGIAASRRNPDVLWVHNDSGDTNRVFAINPSGATLGEYVLTGATANDWEDIAVGPGPDPASHYVYVGDIGDNSRVRPQIQAYRFAEPAVDSMQTSVTVPIAAVETLAMTYEDGPHDAESMFVDPLGGDLYVVTKEFGAPHYLYRNPAPLAAGPTQMARVATINPGLFVTAADISPGGDMIALRTYAVAYLWRRDVGAGQTVAQAMSAAPCSIPLVSEAFGEAIGFAVGRCGYYTVREGANPPVNFFAGDFCASDAAWRVYE